MLELARRTDARIFQASTSEVYGDPEVHPRRKEYWGNVNPIGPRACYDEGNRCAETLFFDYHRQYQTDIRVGRIFNTYGPRMHPQDGRVVSNFIVQALSDTPITLIGDGSQTRSFCYVDDLISAMTVRAVRSPGTYPLRQWSRVRGTRRSDRARQASRPHPVHHPGLALGKRLQRELQRQAEGRVPEPRNLLHAAGSPGADRGMEVLLQHRNTAQFARLSTTRAGGLLTDKTTSRIRSTQRSQQCGQRGQTLTLELDHLMHPGHSGHSHEKLLASSIRIACLESVGLFL